MNAERYENVERLFHEALEHPAEERDSFVDRACGADEDLRREVKSLLASDLRARNFIEEPPGEMAAALLTVQSSLLGRKLGHYQIQSKLGIGGMGEVYLAADTRLGRNVAIKVLPPESVGDERAKKRLLREAQAVAKLDHPNICAIHEVGEDQGHCFIVMQYIDGQTLAERIGDCPLPVSAAVDLAIQVADALADAHSRGITHRDIKPQNIMVTSRDQAKVMDFGLARLADEYAAIGSESETRSFVTEPGTIAGTIPYMSPEQVKGAAIDGRSDLFSFGAVLYEIVTGKRCFERGSAAETISAILTEEPRPLAEFAQDVPEELQRIVSKCLAKERHERYSSTGDLLSDLRRLKSNLDSGATLSRAGTKSRNPAKWIRAAAVVVGIALASATFYSLFGKSEREPANVGINSLAILPFVNANDDPAAEYLSDGITESLINSLAQVSRLKVIARTTAFRYKGKDTDPQTLGRDLRVDAVITGRVTKQGDNLIVQADLLNTTDGSQVWGDRFSRKISDVFEVPEQIAREITTSLRFKLSGKETRALAKRYTENIKAYQDYSIGWTYLQRRTGPDFFTAISYFEKAISEEPNYALAHAALTEAYASVTMRGLVEPLEGRRKLEESARKAIALDPNLPEAHVAIAQLLLYFPPYNFSAGEQEVRYAIELNPNMSQAYLVLGAALLEQGRLDEALEVWSKGREIDPLSAIIARLEAYTYLQKNDYPRAYELLRQSRALAPPFIIFSEAEVYARNGKVQELLTELEKAKLDRSDDPYVIYSEGVAAAQGSRAETLKTIKRLEQLSGSHHEGTLLIAMLYCALNEKERALCWLERGLEAGAITIFYRNDPVWEPIRNEPRFVNLIQRMAIPKVAT
jgi:serine/threonine-protein kinase